MKKFVILPFAVFALAACNNSSNTVPKEAAKSGTEQSKMPVKQLYICPMDSDITSDKPDTCSKCGMDLIKKEN